MNIDIISNFKNEFTEISKIKSGSNSNKTYKSNDNFKKYLNKEVKKDLSREEKVVSLDKEDSQLKIKENIEKDDSKEILEDCLGKIKNIIDENSKSDDIDMDDIDIDDIAKVISLLTSFLIREDLNVNNEFSIEKLDNCDALIENNLSLDKENLTKDLINLIESISNKDGENSISDNQSNVKDIISSLINIREFNKESKINVEGVSDKKDTISLNEDVKVKIQDIDLEDKSNDSEFLNSSNKDIEEEDAILSKFIGEDSKGDFINTINSYNKIENDLANPIQKPDIINSQTIDNDIIKSVKYMIKNNMEELTVKVYPKELGELTIKILSEEGIMKAEIRATSKETYNIISANIADIKNSLADQNIKIQDVQVEIYNDDTTFFSGQGNSKENPKDNNYLANNRVKSINSKESEEIIVEEIIRSNVNLLV